MSDLEAKNLYIGRVKFSIYDLHLEIDKDPNFGMIKSS